jgi:hypothetical protein
MPRGPTPSWARAALMACAKSPLLGEMFAGGLLGGMMPAPPAGALVSPVATTPRTSAAIGSSNVARRPRARRSTVLPPLGASSLSQYRGRGTSFEWDLLTKCVVPAMAMTHAIERGVSAGCHRVAHSLITQEGAPSRTRAPDAPRRCTRCATVRNHSATARTCNDEARDRREQHPGPTHAQTRRSGVGGVAVAQPRGRPRTRSAMMLR